MKGVTTQQGRETLNRFKMEAASEVGVNLKQGYNGDLTSREAGSDGGQMGQNERTRTPIFIPTTKTACKHRRISDYIPDRNSRIIAKPPCPKNKMGRAFGVLRSVRSLE